MMPSKPQAHDAPIAAAYRSGLGLHTIAKRRGITLSKARHALRRQGVQLRSRLKARMRWRRRAMPSDESVLAVYEETGHAVRQVAARLGIAKETVRASLRRSGVSTQPAGGRWMMSPEKRREVVEASQKRGIATAARLYGINRSTVQRYRSVVTVATRTTRIRVVQDCAGCNFPTTDGRWCLACQLVS